MPIKQIRSFLIAKSYDFAMRSTERRCLRQWRQELLSHAQGDVLEIGAGTGINLPHYPKEVTCLILSEPDIHMRRKLQKRVAQIPTLTAEITPWEAAKISSDDNSFDTIVSTLVLCSVPNLQSSLAEIYRLLRPHGKLLFLEHVLSDHLPTRNWQHRIEPLWSLCAGECKLTRDTATAIKFAGLTIDHLTDSPMIGAPSFVSRTIRGIAQKVPSPIA